jgi:branched-chain amino acid transport system substrate-binding protein
MKRKLLVLMAVLLVVAMATSAVGCRRESGGSNSGDEDTILIGGAMAVTGIQGPLDAPAMEGIVLAVEEINEKGGINGKKLEFRNMDSKSDSATSSEVAKQLIDQGAVAIITSSDYDFGGPAARAAQAAGLVGITTNASSPLFGSKMLGDKQFTLSMWNTTMSMSSPMTLSITRRASHVILWRVSNIMVVKSCAKMSLVKAKLTQLP